MASSSRGPKRYKWEMAASAAQPAGEPADEPESSDYEEPSEEEAGARLVDFLLDQLYNNAISARSLCVTCYWASKAGAQGVVKDFALHPGSSSGKFMRKVDSATGLKLKSVAAPMYKVPAPLYTKYDLGRSSHKVLMQLPHEELAKEFAEFPAARNPPQEGQQTEAFTTHPVVVQNQGRLVLPYALYLDGVSFTRPDSLLGIFCYFVGTQRRHLLAVLRRSHVCRCGCRGWCTLYPVFQTLRWSMGALAAGRWPETPPVGEWGPDDAARAAKGGTELGFHGALLQVKGDWSEFAHTLGLADWSSRLHCCLFCHATRENRFDLAGFTPSTNHWGDVCNNDLEQACRNCEHWRKLNKEQLQTVVAALVYDKRKQGGAGRCLAIDIPELDLLRNDRVEPHPQMQDVAMLDHAKTPCWVLFWRKASETRCRHRNPLLDPALGLGLDALMVDSLHTLYLGPAQVWVCHTLWQLILADVFETGTKGETLHAVSVQRIRSQLWEWYRRRRAERPTESMTEVSDLTVQMLGRQNAQILHTKAAETKGLVPFTLQLLKDKRHRLDQDTVGFLEGAGDALQTYIDLLGTAPLHVPPPMVQAMMDSVKRHVLCSAKAGVPMKPKHHLLLHMASRTPRHGCPTSYSTFRDEGINRVLKRVGQAAHRSVWEARVFSHFGRLEEQRMGGKLRR